jgi:hypothetical protein
MEPIKVPSPSPSSFNKHRPPSDLLLSQLKYFQHLDGKHDHGIDPTVSKDVGTEAGAARYIALMTRSIRSRALAAGHGTMPPAIRKAASRTSLKAAAGAETRGGLRLVAAEEKTEKKTKVKKGPQS